MEEKKQFPTPAMQKAQEEWDRKPELEKKAIWSAVRAELERHYKNGRRPIIDPGPSNEKADA